MGIYGMTHVSYWRSFPRSFALYLTTSRSLLLVIHYLATGTATLLPIPAPDAD